MNNTKVMIVIPARGGSKGIPRKNLRTLNGRPLISYSIETALNSRYQPDVVVSSDDDEILAIADKLGAQIHRREKTLANDICTLDPVIYDAYFKFGRECDSAYRLIVTLQPTSPLLKVSSLDGAIEQMLNNPQIDTLISASEDTHLTWRREESVFCPNYVERVNRQYLPPTYRETGAFLITRPSIISPTSRIGANVDLYLLSDGEEIDVDTFEDWSLCEYILQRKKVLFVVSGYDEIGLGHVYRSLLLAGGILSHHLLFLVDRKSQIALQKIGEQHYEVHIQQADNLLDDIFALEPDVVINDILDTDKSYMEALKGKGMTVVNFEDLGDGAPLADLVINALYPEKKVLKNHYFGHSYFCARDEFIYSVTKQIGTEVAHVLVSYGGVDPNNLTLKTLESIYDFCVQNEIKISVVLGMGYKQLESLTRFLHVEIHRNTSNISSEMLKADIAFTSAGRTVFELACIGTPSIVMAQNNREMTHLFATAENGFINLGLGVDQAQADILDVFRTLAVDCEQRKMMNEVMLGKNVRSGRERVLKLIQAAISGE
jgi:CMP-N-acetylneuraminic acid synthetase/spore coat polysaccharide biosynthesis predicted glycosyltransferase SpsG